MNTRTLPPPATCRGDACYAVLAGQRSLLPADRHPAICSPHQPSLRPSAARTDSAKLAQYVITGTGVGAQIIRMTNNI